MKHHTTAIVAAVVMVLAACSSDQETAGSTTPSSTAPATSTTVTGSTTTAAPATTARPTTTAVTTTTASCDPIGDTARKESADPLAMSSMVGSDIRTGGHDCSERIVIELSGTGEFPGWWVEYVDDPVTLSPSDQTVEIAGDATLQVRLGVWMPDMEGNGYDGSTDITPTNVSHVLQLRQTENYEGVTIWSIGLDGERPFTVTVMDAPARLVIDISTAD